MKNRLLKMFPWIHLGIMLAVLILVIYLEYTDQKLYLLGCIWEQSLINFCVVVSNMLYWIPYHYQSCQKFEEP